MVSREPIYLALFAQLKTGGFFKTYTRRWQSIWDDLAAQSPRTPDLPMLIQQAQVEIVHYTNRGIGRVLTLETHVEVFSRIPDGATPGFKDGTTSGDTVVNAMLDAVDNALAPDAHEGLQTLGGLVLDCRIEGLIMKTFGDEDPSGLCGAVIPITMLLSS